VVGLLDEAFHGGLLPHERDHDVAVLGELLRTYDDEIALEDADVLH
jgi:hypothetical protein